MSATSVVSTIDTPIDGHHVVDVMGLPVWSLDRSGLIDLLVGRAVSGVASRVCYLNAHTWHLSRTNHEFREALTTADVLYADGMSVVWASRIFGTPLPTRLTSADYVDEFARACAARGASVYLLGGLDGVADLAAARLVETAPGLRVAGTHSGYFDLEDGSRVVNLINRAAPDLLLVGMGNPRQELWSAKYRDSLSVPVIWSVGALFDYVADIERRAPQWLCRNGLEWAFRLAMDPMGKTSRYLLENPMFVASVLKTKLHQALGLPRRREPGVPVE